MPAVGHALVLPAVGYVLSCFCRPRAARGTLLVRPELLVSLHVLLVELDCWM